MIELYRCLDCQQVFSVIQMPENRAIQMDGSEEANAEWSGHRDHQLEVLKPLEDSVISREPYDNPLRTVYFMASNGKERFLVIRKKSGLYDSCRYELRRGSIRNLPPTMTLREEFLLKQIIWEKNSNHPTTAEIVGLVKILKGVLKSLAVDDLIEEIADLHHPMISYGRPPESFFDEVSRQCLLQFPEATANWFRDFIDRNQDVDGPLGIELKSNFEVVDDNILAAEAIAGGQVHRAAI